MAQENTSTGTPAPHPVPHALHAGPAPPPGAPPRPAAGPPPPRVPPPGPPPGPGGGTDAGATVYALPAGGEGAVGVGRAGSPDGGLVHYARRFDDVRTEVELLETR